MKTNTMIFLKFSLLPVLFFSLINICCAQDEEPQKEIQAKNNTVKQFIGNFYIHESPGIELPVRQLGLYYERKVLYNFYAGVGYMQWDPMKLFTHYDVMGISEEPLFPAKKPVVGELGYRSSYKMIDCYIFYKLKIKSKHSIDMGVGMTYCWGTNAYVLFFYQGTPTDATAGYEARKENYWGAVPNVSYSYLLFNDMMNIGVDLKMRAYEGRPKVQYDYGVHIGVNF